MIKAFASQHVDRSVRWMVIKKATADTEEDFFYADAPFVLVPMRIALGRQITLMAAA